MKIVMTLLVRNEQDVIAANLDYHLRQGVDYFIVTDNLSEDDTPAILREYENRGVLHYLHEASDDYAQSAWVTRMARMAAVEHGADWVINNDADEFWWPMVGDLKDALSAVPDEANVVRARRHNFLAVPDDRGLFFDRMTVREARSLNPLGSPLPDKVCHRAHRDIVVAQGNHQVSGVPVVHSPVAPLEILHYPMRSYAQFENKIRLGGQAYERNRSLPPEVGRTWRVLYDLYRLGGLPERYAQDVLTDERRQAGLAAGDLVEDPRLRDFMATDTTASASPGSARRAAGRP